MSVTLEQLPSGPSLKRFLVKNERGAEVGLIEKFTDDKFTINPWKAFSGIGEHCQYVGSFYDGEGGKRAAINAVLRG